MTTQSDIERIFAENFRVARIEQCITQYAVAARMRDRGYTSWREKSVGYMERHLRLINLGEATALSEIVGFPLLLVCTCSRFEIERRARDRRVLLEVD